VCCRNDAEVVLHCGAGALLESAHTEITDSEGLGSLF